MGPRPEAHQFLTGRAGQEANQRLAGAINKGTLDEHPTLRALVSMVVRKAERLNQGVSARITRSSHEDEDVDPGGTLKELALFHYP